MMCKNLARILVIAKHEFRLLNSSRHSHPYDYMTTHHEELDHTLYPLLSHLHNPDGENEAPEREYVFACISTCGQKDESCSE